MRSLRSRLILGSSLVAVVPLAVAMFLMSRQIERTVRTQAEQRLAATIGGLQVQLRDQGASIGRQLEILGHDPMLKRLYLVRSAGARDLFDYLAERRVLLGLDVLEVRDPKGARIADGSVPGSDTSFVMATSAPILYENASVGDVRGGLVLDADYLRRMATASGVDLTLTDAAGRRRATTAVSALESGHDRVLRRSFPIEIESVHAGTITGIVSTADADRAIAAMQLASLLLGLLGIAIAIVLGAAWSAQVSRPVEQLAVISDRLAQGQWDEPVALRSVRELDTLVFALDRMRTDLRSYRERLVVSERQEAWGQMARKVAHEVKNPLTPIAISVADLKRSYDLGRPDFPQILDGAVRIISEEVETLKRMLQEFSEYGRFPAPRPAPCSLGGILADLATLYGRDVAEDRLAVTPPPRDVTLVADAGQIRQALVNLVKNGLEAVNGDGRVSVAASAGDTAVEITVANTGPGLDADQRARLFVPGFTTKSAGMGMGLTIVERIVSDHGGTIAVESEPRRGTTFRIRLPREPRA